MTMASAHETRKTTKTSRPAKGAAARAKRDAALAMEEEFQAIVDAEIDARAQGQSGRASIEAEATTATSDVWANYEADMHDTQERVAQTGMGRGGMYVEQGQRFRQSKTDAANKVATQKTTALMQIATQLQATLDKAASARISAARKQGNLVLSLIDKYRVEEEQMAMAREEHDLKMAQAKWETGIGLTKADVLGRLSQEASANRLAAENSYVEQAGEGGKTVKVKNPGVAAKLPSQLAAEYLGMYGPSGMGLISEQDILKSQNIMSNLYPKTSTAKLKSGWTFTGARDPNFQRYMLEPIAKARGAAPVSRSPVVAGRTKTDVFGGSAELTAPMKTAMFLASTPGGYNAASAAKKYNPFLNFDPYNTTASPDPARAYAGTPVSLPPGTYPTSGAVTDLLRNYWGL
jgi:hypothetical protein